MRFTLWGMNQYIGIFDNITLPSGIDKEDFIEYLLYQCGDLYPYTQVPDRLKSLTENWFRHRKSEFERVISAMVAEYNPIENYNRLHESTVTDNGNESNTGNTTVTDSRHLHSESKNSVSAFDSSTLTDHDKNVTDTSYTGGALTTSPNLNTSNSNVHIENTNDHGNVGVTTNQAMIKEEIDLRRFDIYEEIISQFEDKFLIRVY